MARAQAAVVAVAWSPGRGRFRWPMPLPCGCKWGQVAPRHRLRPPMAPPRPGGTLSPLEAAVLTGMEQAAAAVLGGPRPRLTLAARPSTTPWVSALRATAAAQAPSTSTASVAVAAVELAGLAAMPPTRPRPPTWARVASVSYRPSAAHLWAMEAAAVVVAILPQVSLLGRRWLAMAVAMGGSPASCLRTGLRTEEAAAAELRLTRQPTRALTAARAWSSCAT